MKKLLNITQIKYDILPSRIKHKTIRDRYVEYQRDLFKIANHHLDEDTLYEGDQYSYTDVGEYVLSSIKENMKNIDLFVMHYWTPECDPDYSAFGPYFLHKFELEAESFDVADNGSNGSLVALSIIAKFMENNANIKKALLLGMEQNTIPRSYSDNLCIPSRSSGGALIFEKQEKSNIAVYSIGMLSDIDIASTPQKLMHELTDLSIKYGIKIENLNIYVKRGTFAFRLLNYFSISENKNLRFTYLPTDFSAMTIFLALDMIKKQPNISFFLIIDEDIEGLQINYLLGKKQ